MTPKLLSRSNSEEVITCINNCITEVENKTITENPHFQAICNSRGFSLLEVLIGISVFMIGMLGVTALNISSLKSNTFAGHLS